MHNFFKTALLLGTLTGLFMACGWLIGGSNGMMLAFAIAAAMNFFTYWNADKIVLRMYHAQPVEPSASFYQLVARLAQQANLPMPKVYIIDSPQPNAFATGRNPENAAVAATTGLLQMLNEREIAGVMAHELAHVQNRDTLTSTIAATLAGAIGMLGNMLMFGGNRDGRGGGIGALLMIFLAPLAAMLIQMALSRSREYSADAGGAEISGDPEALASALQKIEHAARNIRNPLAERSPATASLFIVNPLSGERMDNLFTTHPKTENRVARLMAMAGNHSSSSLKRTGTEGPWG